MTDVAPSRAELNRLHVALSHEERLRLYEAGLLWQGSGPTALSGLRDQCLNRPFRRRRSPHRMDSAGPRVD